MALHGLMQPTTYLEIGIFEGDTLRLSSAPRTIGVDPDPQLDQTIEKATIYKLSSNEFFDEKAKNVFYNQLIDLAFIDGLHYFDQVLKDFINTERFCHSQSVIVLHDVLPRNFLEASPVRVTGSWAGDVWRLIPCLHKYRPDLRISVIDTAPTGLAIIQGLDASNTFLPDNYSELVEELKQVNTLQFLEARDLIMHTIPSNVFFLNFFLDK